MNYYRIQSMHNRNLSINTFIIGPITEPVFLIYLFIYFYSTNRIIFLNHAAQTQSYEEDQEELHHSQSPPQCLLVKGWHGAGNTGNAGPVDSSALQQSSASPGGTGGPAQGGRQGSTGHS